MPRTVSKEESGLLLRADGSWWHNGQPATHERLRRFLHRQIRRDPRGEYYLYNALEGPDRRLLEEHVYFEVEDTAYFVTSVHEEDDALVARLNTEAEVDLDAGCVLQDAEGRVYGRLPSGELARFDRHATTQLEPWLEAQNDGYCLRIGSRRMPIERVERRSAVSPPAKA